MKKYVIIYSENGRKARKEDYIWKTPTLTFCLRIWTAANSFFVEINWKECGSYKEARKKAIEIANENFDNAKIQPGWLPAYEAEAWGLDTY